MSPSNSAAPIPLRRPVENDPAPPAPATEATPKATAHGGLSRRKLLGGVGALALLVAVAAGGLYVDYSNHFATTDDAFIAARQFAVAPKVPGYLTSVPVTDNQHVGTGDVIARIDQRDYQVALAQAEAAVAAAQAGIANIDAQIEVQQAQITASETQVKLSRGPAGLRAAAGRTLRHADQGWLVEPADRRTCALGALSAAGRGRERTGQRHAWPSASSNSLKAQRNTAVASLAAGAGATRPGAAQPVLHDRDARPSRDASSSSAPRSASSPRPARRCRCSCPTRSGSRRTSRRRSSTPCDRASR